ncbi:MAG: hypothetical protein KatS3mg052_1218 [Candidatus Roseilinea sp.]|nr:MAG: hypothetical protein KatS3mg052_1218 [Candidatus Roseilinea sp.]
MPHVPMIGDGFGRGCCGKLNDWPGARHNPRIMPDDRGPARASAQFEALFTEHGAASFDKQIYLAAMLRGGGWAFDVSSGILALRRPHEASLRLSVQVLGAESEDSGTWLWGWANRSGIPEALLHAAQALRAFGMQAGVPELVIPELPIGSPAGPQRLAMVGCGAQRADCFFRARYPRGALYLLIKDPRYKRSVR